MEWLTRFVTRAEKDLGIRFDKVRHYVKEFIKQPLPIGMNEAVTERVKGEADRIKQFLADQKLGSSPGTAIPPFE